MLQGGDLSEYVYTQFKVKVVFRDLALEDFCPGSLLMAISVTCAVKVLKTGWCLYIFVCLSVQKFNCTIAVFHSLSVPVTPR